MDIVGGQAIQANALLEGFKGEPECEIAFAPTNPPLPKLLSRVKYVRTLLRFLIFLPMLFLRLKRCDVLHIFTPAYTAFFVWTVPAMAVGRILKKKVVLHYHDGRGYTHVAESPLAVRCMSAAHVVVTPSDYLVDAFARHNVSAISIPNVLDTSHLRFRTRNPLRPVFLTNRGLEPLYNVACVIRAFAAIQQQYPEARLVVAHDGPCRGELEELARTLNLANVVFAGTVSQKRMAELYDAADIFMMSPDIDNMPGTVLECYAAGLPVVSTNAGGIPYIVKNEWTGLLVNCGDSNALAAAACRLLRDPAYARELARRGYNECAQYSWKSVGPRWISLYSELTGIPAPEKKRAVAVGA